MVTITDTYSGTNFKKYAQERAKRITQGWKLLDENLLQKDVYLDGRIFCTSVTGCVVYKMDNQ